MNASIALQERMLEQLRLHEASLKAVVARGRFDYATYGVIAYLKKEIVKLAIERSSHA